MPSGKEYIESLHLAGLLTEPAQRQAIHAFGARQGTKGLDVGCGSGEKTLWFADEIGPAGSVIGIDTESKHLAAAKDAAAEAGLSANFTFKRGDLHRLPFENASFDWAWSADTLWPVPGNDPIAGVKEMRRVVKPGGSVGLMFWANHTFLPGFPLLEAELNLAHTKINPYLTISVPHLHHMNALGWLRESGFENPSASAYTACHNAPLTEEKRRAILFCINMFWENVSEHVSEKDWDLFQRLIGRGRGDSILESPDYVCSITYFLFRGCVPYTGGSSSVLKKSNNG
jgi:ubiquinone/menaquinone biosynthesis C-methylase UbiE